ncbi:SMP-30/gluconolactonase/LRE family protein [Sphingosinicella sp.]|uniref:SMP-30/gluconolactonase/LRE family protein n=1 Tax=Sphingosinicella sp. TaxID=1917971 RepID=UPI0040381D03
MLAAAHERGDAAAVRVALWRLAQSGYAPSAATMALLAPHLSAADLEALRLRLEGNRSRVQASRLAALVPADHRLVEGITWDPADRRLFATTVVDRSLLVHGGGRWRRVPIASAGSLFGLALDPRTGGIYRLLWVASGRVEQTPAPETAFRGLIAVDRNTLREVRRIAAPEGGSPADLTVDLSGTLYASDPASGAIYRARPAESTLSVLVPPGRLVNPQGLAMAPSGRWLYASDYVRGLAIIDPQSGDMARLESDVATMLDGIDGLSWFRGGLIAIQNGTSPRRILHLRLSPNGRRIVAVRIIESAHPDWGEPTLGVVMGQSLLYVADAQWERYGPGGAVTGEGPTRPTAIRAARLPR